METNKQITINIPDGYIIDEEKSVLKEGNIVFKKKEVVLPKTWEDVCNNYKLYTSCFKCTVFNLNVMAALQSANRVLRQLWRLQILRDIYRQGWKPRYSGIYLKGERYYSIRIYGVEPLEYKIESNYSENVFLTFKDKKTAKEFLENFKDLIEECKEFI